MKKILISLVMAFVIAVIPVTVSAVEYGGVGGRPANPREDNPRTQSIFVYQLEPGESFSDGVEVFNNTDTSTTVRIGAVDSIGSSDGAFACAQEAEPKVGVGSWITLSKSSVVVPAGESRVVDFTITAPKTANVGEQSGCITMQDDKQEPARQQGGVVLSFRSAIRVAVTIPGEIIKSINFGPIELIPNENKVDMYTVRPSLINSGNVSLDTTLNVKLVSLFGLQTDGVDATYPILPGTTASWNFDFDKPFWGGLYRADVSATYNDNVEDSLGENSGGENTVITKSSSFVYIAPSPIAILVQVAGLALILSLVGILIAKLLHRRAVAKHWKKYTVKEGQSLQSIAIARKTSWKKLANANKLRAPYHIEPGQIIKIPPKSE